MPEYPDVSLYAEKLEEFFAGKELVGVHLRSPFLLRTVSPPLGDAYGRKLRSVKTIGKRFVLDWGSELYFVIHLMIAGRFHVAVKGGRNVLAEFIFPGQVLYLTEAGKKKRASLHVVAGTSSLATFDRGGVSIWELSKDEFARRIQGKNQTLKRALTDPTVFAGIGNAYSDEILHQAQLSPLQRTQNLSVRDCAHLHKTCQEVLSTWRMRLRSQWENKFPEKVTAFHPEMQVHGKYRQRCPVCSDVIQRVVSRSREFHYCPGCQTNGKPLADRSLSRLLKDSWQGVLAEDE